MAGREAEERLHRTVRNRVALANFAGALTLWAYLELSITPVGRADAASIAADFASLVVIVAVFTPPSAWWAHRSLSRACGWLAAGRSPTPDERVATLRAPLRQALQPLAFWAVALLIFVVADVVVGHPAASVLRIAVMVVFGALTTCALTFLWTEAAFRPIFALALANEAPAAPLALGIRGRFLLAWAIGSGLPLLALVLSPVVHEDGSRVTLGVAVALLAGIGLVAGVVATVGAAGSVADPLGLVRDALGAVGEGQLEVEVPVDDAGEVGLLESGVNRMVEGLRERRRLQDLFGRHVGVEVARHALEQGAGLEAEQREASALFVDLVGSTAMAEVLAPAEVVARLNDFFDAVVSAVSAEGGWVNKFEGDGALCVFGAPAEQPDHAGRALRAARSLCGEIERLRAVHPGLAAGIGVSSGPVVAGNVGTVVRYEYTVIGQPVNEAARLSDLAKSRSVPVLASGGALDRAGNESQYWVGRGSIALRGQSAPAILFEPVDPGPLSVT